MRSLPRHVGVNPLFTHHMPDICPSLKIDPMRFTDEAQRNRHRFAGCVCGGRQYVLAAFPTCRRMFARHFLQISQCRWSRLHRTADVAIPKRGWFGVCEAL